MFIPFYLTSPVLVVSTDRGHLMPLTVSLELSLIHMPNLPWVMVFLGEGAAPPALVPLLEARIQDTTYLLFWPNLMLTILLPNPLIIRIRSLVLQLLQHQHLRLPCLLNPCNSSHHPLKRRWMHSRDSWLPNHLTDRWPLNLPLLVPPITRSS